MAIRISTKFKKTYEKMNLTEQGRQVAGRMLDHIQVYEYHATKKKDPQIRVEVLLGKSLFEYLIDEREDGETNEHLVKTLLRPGTLETMTEVYLDLLRTYWAK